MKILENGSKNALNVFSDSYKIGQWMRSITGIGPVISAGFLTHLDIRQAPHAGNFWSFAGLNPNVIWAGKEKVKGKVKEIFGEWDGEDKKVIIDNVCAHFGRRAITIAKQAGTEKNGNKRKLTIDNISTAIARRPWNAKLKVLCWKLGESFVKVKGKDTDFYGKIYARARAYDDIRNERGEFEEQAKLKLEKFNIGKETDAYAAYSKGKLPPGHLFARAKRIAVKLFLSHLHEVMFVDYYDVKPDDPYAFQIEGHGDRVGSKIEPPNWPYKGNGKGKGLRKLYASEG